MSQAVIDEIKSLLLDNVSKKDFETELGKTKELVEKRHEDLKTEIKAATDDSIVKAFKELEKALEQKLQVKNDNGIVMPDKKIYGANFNEFLRKTRTNPLELKGLSENVGADGGYLVPDVWSNEIIKVSLENAVVRPRARSITMTSNNYSMPYIKGNSNAKGSVFGGVNTYWADEGEDMSASKTSPKIGKLQLVAHKMIGYTEAENELVEDSPTNIGNLLQQLFGEAIAFEEDDVFINGNGVGKPLGILNTGVRVSVTRSTASQINLVDIVNMYSRFTGNLNNAVWMTNQSTIPQLFGLKDDNLNNIFLGAWGTGLTGKPAGSLLGIPVQVTEKCSALGTEGDLCLADFGYYMIGDRTGLRVEYSDQYKFNTDTKVWKFVKRVEGRPWLASSITPRRGGSTLSPIVTLK